MRLYHNSLERDADFHTLCVYVDGVFVSEMLTVWLYMWGIANLFFLIYLPFAYYEILPQALVVSIVLALSAVPIVICLAIFGVVK